MATGEPQIQNRYELLLGIDTGDQGGLIAEGEEVTMRGHGEVVAHHVRKELPAGAGMASRGGEGGAGTTRHAGHETGASPDDFLADANRLELSRAISALQLWEQRLRRSPLDTKLQDFVAYHQEVIQRFRSWFALHGIKQPPGDN